MYADEFCGGSELWTYLVGVEAFSQIYRESDRAEMSPAETREMLEKLNREKSLWDAMKMGNDQHFIFQTAPRPVELSSDVVNKCFEEAHKRVFALAKSKIEIVARCKASPQIVISGGTSRHPRVTKRLEEFCAAAGTPEPNFITGSPVGFSSSMIAEEVAIASSNSLTTMQQFMDRGAAFGVQMRQCPNSSNNNPERLWDDYGFFLLSKVG